MTKILGISAFYHDSAACLVEDGNILSAAQEERFTRKKHDPSFPKNAIEYCLKSSGIFTPDLDYVAFYEQPKLKIERLINTYLQYAPRGIESFSKALDLWARQKLWIKQIIRKNLKYQGKIIFPEHHQSHAASAFFPSPYKEAAFLTVDGVGECSTTTYGVGKNNSIDIISEIHFPHSLGLLYSAFTYYLGFKVNSGEYKVMGLAPYGEPKYVDMILNHLIDVKEDGSFRMDMKYFNYCEGLTMTNKHFDELFGEPPRRPESKLRQRDMDLAASIQGVIEEVILKIAQHIKKETGQKYLCLAGGVALNCVANGKLLKRRLFDNIWIQPAAGDAGGALGAALFAYYQTLGNKREVGAYDSMKGTYLGPEFSEDEILNYLDQNGVQYEKLSLDQLPVVVSSLIAQGNIVGWFQGRMEFGPRALGARSIIGDPRNPIMQRTMNLKVKFRESFRPFAPSVLAEKSRDYFDLDKESPYMLLIAQIKKERQKEMTLEQRGLFGLDKLNVVRSDIPAVTHVDYSARVHTVTRETNSLFYEMILNFERNHGCPIVINTSFNVRGEPIVCSPQDAYRCFMRTDIDYLVMGPYLIDKRKQSQYRDEEIQYDYELD